MQFKSNETFSSQVVSYIKKEIFGGRLKPGQKISPIREFAVKCSLNPNTIVRAYAELEEEKLIYTDSTLGKFVTLDKDYIEKKRLEFIDAKINELQNELQECGIDKEELKCLMTKK